jgi:hypothetical protein
MRMLLILRDAREERAAQDEATRTSALRGLYAVDSVAI